MQRLRLKLKLTDTESALLAWLIEHGPTAEPELIAALEGIAPRRTSNALHVHMTRIRRKVREFAVLGVKAGAKFYERGNLVPWAERHDFRYALNPEGRQRLLAMVKDKAAAR